MARHCRGHGDCDADCSHCAAAHHCRTLRLSAGRVEQLSKALEGCTLFMRWSEMQQKSLILFAIMVMLPFILPACTNNTLHTSGRAPLPANLLVSNDHTVEHAEPFLAVNPRNPLNLLGAAWVYTMQGLSVVHMGTFVSFDGGHSWHDNGLLPLPPGFDDTAAETVIFTPPAPAFVFPLLRQEPHTLSPPPILLCR